MKKIQVLLCCLGVSLSVQAKNEIDMETTRIKGNQELPQILYVVPWKESKTKKISDPKLVLHNLLGDFYEPQIASDWK